MNRELVGVPRSTRDAIAPRASAVDRRHERASFDRDPESLRLAWMARDPSNVMRIRFRWKGPFGRRRQSFQPACWLPCLSSIDRAPYFAWFGADPDDVTLHRARGDRHDRPTREANRLPRMPAIVAPEHARTVSATPRTSLHLWIGDQAGRTIVNPAAERGRPSLDVEHDDVAVSGNENRHRCALSHDCRAKAA